MPTGGTTHEAVTDLHKALLADKEKGVPKSKSGPLLSGPDKSGPLLTEIAQPGGFRREFLNRKADQDGVPVEQRPLHWQTSFMTSVRPLIRVGYFESILGIRLNEEGEQVPMVQGECGLVHSILTLVKSFVGTGILFLPGAFLQGGWLFSPLVLVGVAALTAICIWLLLDCSNHTGLQSFGDIAEKAAGPVAREAVHISLVISQFGCNVAYIIFIKQMAESLGAMQYLDEREVIMALVIVLVPVCFVRSFQKLEYAILLADFLIFVGLAVVLWYALENERTHGWNPELQAFKPTTCGLFIGTAVFSFEGTPFILPVRSSMREPERFWPMFVVVYTFIVVFFVVFGFVGYIAYGDSTAAIVIQNLPSDDSVVSGVRAAYLLALLLGFPLVFLPAARVTELWIFGVLHEKGARKWSKNALRAVEVCALGLIALYGGGYFEKFLAFTGALCCAPIAFVYPAFFHLRLCAGGIGSKLLDGGLVAFGVITMVFVLYTTATT